MSLFFFVYFLGFNLNFSESVFSSFMDWFHIFNYSLLLGVLFFVSILFYFLFLSSFLFKSGSTEYQFSELLCSVFPTFILLVQMFPSLGLLYYYGFMNLDTQLTVKVIGHQWYWTYDLGDVLGLDFDSYMKSLDMLVLGESRLLDVDNRCVLPNNLDIRFCVTSSDVLHSWSLVNLSLKLDAMSGVISVLNYIFPLVGVFYGQCSEICGANHSFMPIVVEVTLFDFFKNWCFLSKD